MTKSITLHLNKNTSSNTYTATDVLTHAKMLDTMQMVKLSTSLPLLVSYSIKPPTPRQSLEVKQSSQECIAERSIIMMI